MSLLNLGGLVVSQLSRQAVSDKALGGSMLFVAALVFVYYTTWAILLVSIPRDAPLHISHLMSAAIFRHIESDTRLLSPP